jgi:hypothetical protein
MSADVLFQNGGAQSRDVLTFIAGEYLGAGASRDVWVCGWDPELVVKRETINPKHRFQNHAEYAVWESVKGTEHERWFAPILHVSDSGLWSLQRRTRPVTLEQLRRELPLVPAFFTDLKTGNWGRLKNGRIVCHDYGLLLTAHRGLNGRMKRAKWWVEQP